MWVSQTYLGTVEPDSDLFVYYLFEDYVPEHKRFTQALQDEMARLGYTHGHRVSLFMPQPQYSLAITAEIRDQFEPLWRNLDGKLPGLLLTRKQLREIDTNKDEVLYLAFAETTPRAAAELMKDVRRIVRETLEFNDAARRGAAPERASLGKRFFDALELKPGMFGIKIDLKKLGGQQ